MTCTSVAKITRLLSTEELIQVRMSAAILPAPLQSMTSPGNATVTATATNEEPAEGLLMKG